VTTRQKTIEFATTVDLTVIASAANVTKSLAIFIPETVVAFRSVALICILRDGGTAAATGTVPVLGISTDGVTWDDLTLSNPPANSGESQGQVWARDVTSYFTTNWTGTTNTWQVRFRETTLTTCNHSFKLVITYDYDDTATTHIKTVRIPIESTRQYITTTYQTLGGATAIPAIEGSYFPENSVVIREAFIEFSGYGGLTTAATDYTLSFRINGGTARDFWFHEGALTGNAIPIWSTYRIDDIEDLSAARSLEVISTGLTNVGARMGGWITVTYEFNASTSTTIYNSLMLGGSDTVGSIPGTTAADAESWGRNIRIQEPGPVTLKESAVVLTMNSAAPAAGTINVACGAQANTAYTMVGSSSFEMGVITVTHRIDAGGQNGAAFATLARGSNAYELRIYASAAGVWWNLAGCMILNYTSGKATAGVGAHSQTRARLIRASDSNAASTVARTTGTVAAAVIPETDYWLVGACLELRFHAGAMSTGGISVDVEHQAGEGEGEGWESLYAGVYATDNEFQGPNVIWGASRSAWRRSNFEVETDRFDIEVARQWQVQNSAAIQANYSMLATWYAHTWSSTIIISGSAGGTVQVDVYSAVDDTHLRSLSRVGDGSVTVTLPFDTEDVYVVCYEDDTHLGRSANFTPGD
jgi:hypothetical protein